jgi:hypothetical protein
VKSDLLTFLVLLSTSFAFGCGEQQPDAANQEVATTRIEVMISPAGSGSAEPFLFSTSDGLLLSWLEPVKGTDRVALRVSRHRGGEWSAPRTIIERNDLFVNWADFPSVVEDLNGDLFAHWLQKSGSGTYAYDVRMSTSTDDGVTWRKSFLLNRDGKQAEHGFVTLKPLPRGGVGATWLDGRNMKTGGGHDEHDAGDMAIRYAAVSAEGSISSDVELDGRTCECCTTGMTMAAAGPVIAYRDRSPEEVRDISYVRQDATGWTSPRPVHVDDWKINACPVNGPQLDAIGNRVVMSWFTAANERQRVYTAFSNDSGATFGTPIVSDDGKPAGRVDAVMLDDRRALVCWLEQTPAGAEIRARIVGESGVRRDSVKIADSSTARGAGFPRIAKAGDEIWFAWTDQTATEKNVQLARARF